MKSFTRGNPVLNWKTRDRASGQCKYAIANKKYLVNKGVRLCVTQTSCSNR